VPPKPVNLGKLISKHPTAPAYVQRAAIVALLSFVFFLAMLFVFLMRQQAGYLILAAAFLVVNIFTLIGFLMQRRNVVRVFENGISYGKAKIEWKSVKTIQSEEKNGLTVVANDGTAISIPKTISGFESLAKHILTKVEQ
jgi:hypothetical protein